MYGKELILDLHDCDANTFNRMGIAYFFDTLCDKIDMQKGPRHFWDDVGVPEEEKQIEPHLKGTSAIQFIMTSNITIHTLDILKCAYINVFSCKDFNNQDVKDRAMACFGGHIVNNTEIERY